MAKATYDPTNKNADAFNSENTAFSSTSFSSTTVKNALEEVMAVADNTIELPYSTVTNVASK
jgi:hypothetical protein